MGCARLRVLLAVALSGAACSPDPFQRMEDQPKYLPYSESPLFEDGRAMRTPPLGTIPRERMQLRVPPGSWRDANGYLTRIPIALDVPLLARARERFEIYCATCHGLLGDGNSVVARNMSVRPPPSLHTYADRPPGFFFEVVTEGYGLMPSYANQIPLDERWALVAYVYALHRSQRASLNEVPPDVRGRLLRATP
jgi:mono/diheme cytochrome c family protein